MATQQPVELILLRQLSSYLAIPVWMVDASGNLVYYNGPAERLLGLRFDDSGTITADDLVELFKTTELDGTPLEQGDLPLVIALTDGVASHRSIRICGLDKVWRNLAVTAMPLIGQGSRMLGAFATFREIEE